MINTIDLIDTYKKQLEDKGISDKITMRRLTAMKTFLKYFEEKGIAISEIDKKVLEEFYKSPVRGSLTFTARSRKNHFRDAINFLERENLINLNPNINKVASADTERNCVPMKMLVKEYEKQLDLKGFTRESRKIPAYWLNVFMTYLSEHNITDIRNVTRKAVSDFSLFLLLYIGERKHKPLAVSTRFNVLITVKNFFKFLCKKEILLTDPARDVELPKLPKRISRDILTVKEIDAILSAVDIKAPNGIRDYAMIETLYGCGMRGPELLKLSVKDIDFENRLVSIRQGKGKKDRTVPINDTALSRIREYLYIAPVDSTGSPTKTDGGFLFRGSAGKISNDSLRFIINKYAKRAGIKKHLVPHSFRYACATHMLRNGADIRFIQEMLGHEKIVTTQGYTKVVKGDLKRMIKQYHPREVEGTAFQGTAFHE
jgi:integrase/recombinase XerD